MVHELSLWAPRQGKRHMMEKNERKIFTQNKCSNHSNDLPFRNSVRLMQGPVQCGQCGRSAVFWRNKTCFWPKLSRWSDTERGVSWKLELESWTLNLTAAGDWLLVPAGHVPPPGAPICVCRGKMENVLNSRSRSGERERVHYTVELSTNLHDVSQSRRPLLFTRAISLSKLLNWIWMLTQRSQSKGSGDSQDS